MKKLLLVGLSVLFLGGCVHSSSYEYGNRIDESKVQMIIKGKTTEDQLITLFGEPQFKTVLNEKDTKYVYMFTESSASVQTFTLKTDTTAKQTTLDVLVRDGVVLNFALQKSDLMPKFKQSTVL